MSNPDQGGQQNQGEQQADMCSANRHVRFTPKADMCGATRHVRFVPIADIRAA